MKQKILALIAALALLLSLTACGGKETAVTGMIVAVNGSTMSIVEMSEDMKEMGSGGFDRGNRPEMPEGMENFEGFEGMEGFEGFENFDPEDFENMNPEDFMGKMPEGVEMPQWGDGERPEMPKGMTPPEGMEIPENGEMPSFGGMMPGFGGSMSEDKETIDVDITKARVGVEVDGGKESGGTSDLQPGATVTVTMNKKGEASYVLVSSKSFFGGNRRPAN